MNVDGREDTFEVALDWAQHGHRLAWATVMRTWGSSPRPAGSQVVVRSDGLFVGSVSGGCVEGQVIETALEVIQSGVPQQLEFGVSRDQAFEVGLACGGTVVLWVEPVHPSELEVMADLRARKIQACRVVDLGSGTATVLLEEGLPTLPSSLHRAAREALDLDRPGLFEDASGRWFLQPHGPPRRLVVVGAVHIAQSLATIARLADYDVVVVDPRGAFAAPARFERVTVVPAWPDEVLPSLALDRRTALVTLTHDPKLDEPALEAGLRSPAFYLGALGSRKCHAERRARLAAAGFGPADLDRIHGPVGLAIGARSPAEIAIAIMAEITQQLRGGAR